MNRNATVLLICVFAVSETAVSTAQQPAPVLWLTYRKALQLALAKNFQIKIEEFAPKIATARQMSVSGTFDPAVQIGYTYEFNQQDLGALGSTDGASGNGDRSGFTRQTRSAIDTSITGITPWGLSYDFGAAMTRTTDDRSSVNPRNTAAIDASITQPLLRNFGTDVNLAPLRIARADRAISAWQLRQRVIDVMTETITVYNQLYFSIRNLEVAQSSLELAQQTLRDNVRRAEVGVMSPLDVVQAQADVAAREGDVLVAERAVLDNENFLKQLVTDEVANILATRVEISPPPFDLVFKVNEQADLERAFAIRPDYNQAVLDIQKRNITVVFNRNQTLPQLDLVGSLELNGIRSDFGGSLAAIGDPSEVRATVGAVFSLPIPNREARGQLEVSKLEVAQALVDLKRLEQNIYVEADNAAGLIETATKRIESTRAARVFAQETLAAGQARLASGTATTFEVLQFQRDLAAAEIAEVRALTDRLIAIAEYQRRTGITLEANGVAMEARRPQTVRNQKR